MTHICVSKLTIIASDNGLSPGRRQAIIWTNAGTLLIGHLGTNFGEILIEIHTFLFKKIDLKMSSGKWRPSCLGLNVLRHFLSFYILVVAPRPTSSRRNHISLYFFFKKVPSYNGYNMDTRLQGIFLLYMIHARYQLSIIRYIFHIRVTDFDLRGSLDGCILRA